MMKNVRLGFWVALASVLALAVAAPAIAGKINAAGDETMVMKLKTPDGGTTEQQGNANGAAKVYLDPAAATPIVQTAGIAPDGGLVADKSTAGGIKKTTVDGMCLGACVKVTATQVADGGVATLVPGQWYEFKVVGTGGDGCFSQSGAVVACTGAGGTMTLEAGERFHEAFLANAASVDGGPLDQVKLSFLAMSATVLSVTVCPKVPCQ